MLSPSYLPSSPLHGRAARFWSPRDLPAGPSIWLDARRADLMSLGPDGIAHWGDASGAGHHAAQTVPALRPAYVADALDGLPGISCDNAFLTFPGFALTGPFESFALFRPDLMALDGAYPRYLVSNGSGYQSNARKPFFYAWDQRPGEIRLGAGSYVGAYALAPGSRLLSFRSTHTGVTLHVDGTPVLHDPTAQPPQAGIASGMIGAQDSRAVWGEMLIFAGTLSAQDRSRVEGYLAHRWNLSGQLPPSHPHADRRP